MSEVINIGNIDPALCIMGNPTANSIKPPPIYNYKYNELDILNDMIKYVNRTYGEHYKKENLECLDAWIARGTASTTCLDTAEKYLWRYGSKKGKNKDDLMKAMHYIMLTLYNDHYKIKGE